MTAQTATNAKNARLEVTKTYKMFVGGQFPRSESGRSLEVRGAGGEVLAHACHASRKDLRDAVVAARAAFEGASGWPRRSAYNRGQILYRLAEMLEGKKREFVEAIESVGPASKAKGKGKPAPRGKAKAPGAAEEVAAAIDRLVAYAGWADKFSQVLGCHNPVAGPYYNFTVPEATGVVCAVCPDARPLLALVSLMAPALCAGSTVVALASAANPIPGCVLGEVCATSDVPPGVVNILTGQRGELLSHIAGHREIDAVHAANLSEDEARTLRAGAAENIKRVTVREVPDAAWFDAEQGGGPWWIERFVEMKTIWHPAGA